MEHPETLLLIFLELNFYFRFRFQGESSFSKHGKWTLLIKGRHFSTDLTKVYALLKFYFTYLKAGVLNLDFLKKKTNIFKKRMGVDLYLGDGGIFS